MGLRCFEFLIRLITTCVMLYISFTAIMVYLAFTNVIRFPQDENVYSVQLISIVIGITSAYFALIAFFFDAYIDFSRIFIRLHNVIVLWVLFAQLHNSRQALSLAAYEDEFFEEHFQTEDVFEPDMISKMQMALKRTEVNVLMLAVLNAILTLIFIWKIIKFYLFYYMYYDI